MMNKGSTAVSDTASPIFVNGGNPAKYRQMFEKVSNVNYVNHRPQNGDCKGRQRPGQVRTQNREARRHSMFAECTHQWSADFRKSVATCVIMVKKSHKEPLPPQRGVSLLRPHTASNSSFKRYSCPPIGIFTSSSQSSSSTSSSPCSSPPPIQTSVIIGHDPLGWKLQPKSITSPRDCVKRLSLQIPLPVIIPDLKASAGSTSTSDDLPDQDPSSKNKRPLRPKQSHRCHSDSSVFIRPVVTHNDLRAVHLHSVTRSYESDDVFSEGNEERDKGTTQSCKIPPPVPEKTSMARQMAQLIALSTPYALPLTQQDCANASEMKPKPKH